MSVAKVYTRTYNSSYNILMYALFDFCRVVNGVAKITYCTNSFVLYSYKSYQTMITCILTSQIIISILIRQRLIDLKFVTSANRYF